MVAWLLNILGRPFDPLEDPLQVYGRETGTDVQVRIDGQLVGVQVTEYCADEGTANPGRGLRATEKRDARQGQFKARAIPLQHRLASLHTRVAKKIEKASCYPLQQFQQIWLLVAASLADPDAIASTSLVLLTLDDVKGGLDDEMLRHSKYTKVFIHVQLGDMVYCWTRDNSWRLIHGDNRPPPSGGDLLFGGILPPFPPRV